VLLTALPHLRAHERAALERYANHLRKRFGSRLRDLRLFGSRARGEGREDSDLDVLAVVDDLSSAEQLEAFRFCGDILTDHAVMVGGLLTSTAHWQSLRERERLIVREIERDGIPLVEGP